MHLPKRLLITVIIATTVFTSFSSPVLSSPFIPDPGFTPDYQVKGQIGSDGTHTQNLSLGKPIRDDENTNSASNPNLNSSTSLEHPCTRQSGYRNLGICSDGLYTISTKETDTAGNTGQTLKYTVERDTVNPFAPSVTINLNGNILGQTLGISITGENRSTANIKVTNTKTNKVYNLIKPLTSTVDNLDPHFNQSNTNLKPIKPDNNDINAIPGTYQTDNLLGQLQCGKVTYNITVTITDAAGNTGEASIPQTVTTKDCPVCGYLVGGTFNPPINHPKSRINHPFGYSSNYFSGSASHSGVDFAGAPSGTPVYAAYSGKVEKAYYKNQDNVGKNFDGTRCLNCVGSSGDYGNMVIIDHGKDSRGITVKTIYGHLSPEDTAWLTEGTVIPAGTQIGRMGTTGRSSGPHLHFEVTENGRTTDPTNYIGKQNTNIPEELRVNYCVATGTGGEFPGYPETSKEKVAETIADYLTQFTADNYQILKATDQSVFEIVDEYNNFNQRLANLQAEKENIWNNYDNYIKEGREDDFQNDLFAILEKIDKLYQDLEEAHNTENTKEALLNYLQQSNNLKEQDCAKGVYYLELGQGTDKYEGVIVTNPYNQKAYTVKNGIYDKYKAAQMMCGVIGVPKAEETTAGVQSSSIAKPNEAWIQKFEKGDYKNNGIYAYGWEKGAGLFDGAYQSDFSTQFVVNEVANEYESRGGSWSNYGFATGDTWSDDSNSSYCKQWFEGGEIKLCSIDKLKKEIEDKYGITMEDGDKRWSKEELEWIKEALEILPESIWKQDTVKKVVRYNQGVSNSFSCIIGTKSPDVTGCHDGKDTLYVFDSYVTYGSFTSKYGSSTTIEQGFKINFIHEISHGYHNAHTDILDKFDDISWDKRTSLKSGVSSCDFITSYAMSSNKEDFAETYGVQYIKPERFKEKYNFCGNDWDNSNLKNKQIYAKNN